MEGEDPVSGKPMMRAAWVGYFSGFPNYKISIDELYDRGEHVIVTGHISGSHVLPEIEMIPGSVIWDARVRDGLVSEWVIYPVEENTRPRFNLP